MSRLLRSIRLPACSDGAACLCVRLLLVIAGLGVLAVGVYQLPAMATTQGEIVTGMLLSLPVAVRSVSRAAEVPTMHRSRVAGAAVIPAAAKPAIMPDSPAEALDRISVAADTMAQINEMLTTGASIIVSDQGINQGETGEGTDFIVRLR